VAFGVLIHVGQVGNEGIGAVGVSHEGDTLFLSFPIKFSIAKGCLKLDALVDEVTGDFLALSVESFSSPVLTTAVIIFASLCVLSRSDLKRFLRLKKLPFSNIVPQSG
jgi:hypothetical protein